MTPRRLRTSSIFGVPFLMGAFNEVVSYIGRQKKSLLVLPCDLHSLAALAFEPQLVNAYRQIDICTTDGMPLVWWWRRHYSQLLIERVYGPDLFEELLDRSQHSSVTHFLYGGSAHTLHRLNRTIQTKWPKASIVGWIAPPFRALRPAEKNRYLRQIQRQQPTYLWIGIGSPQQIVLAAEWKQHLPHTKIICVGAAFNFVAHTVPQAPRWVQQRGGEWLFRLLTEPKRLASRYLYKIPWGLTKLILTNFTI